MTWLEQIVADAEGQTPQEGLSYLSSRGVTPDLMTELRVGWLPREYTVPRCSSEFVTFQQWYLRDRLIFPITSTIGTVTGLQTRALTEKKYQIFYDGSRDVFPPLFGLAQAADLMYETEQVVVVEGIFDYVAVRACGVKNVVALMTARPSRQVVKCLKRYVRQVIALLDMDAAGRAGIDGFMTGDFSVVAPVYPSHDPADLAAAGGRDLLTALVSPAKERFWL